MSVFVAPSPATRAAGVTLLHLILVLAGMSLGASIGVRTWFGRDDVTLDSAARLLATDLRQAQNRAAFQHRNLKVAFDRDGDGYVVQDSAGHAVMAPVGSGEFRRKYSRDAVFRGVSIQEVRVEGEGALHYGPNGTALSRGEIVLAFRGSTRTVRVIDDSGRLEIDGLSSPWRDDEF